MIAKAMMIIAAGLLLASAGNAIEIGSIEVEGNINVSEEKILSIFAIRVGEEFKPERVSSGVRALFNTKDFSDIEVRYVEEEGKAVLIVVIREYPRVKEVRFIGNDHIDDDDLRNKILLREGFFARPAMMTRDVATIKGMYEEKGYNKAEIEIKQTPKEKEHKVIVTYAVDEGEKVKIRNIDFLGNGAISSKELRKAMESKTDNWLRGGEYKAAVLEEDLKKIKQLYANQGYLDAVVMLGEQVEIDGGKHVDIFIEIDEGRPYYVGEVTWSGNTIVSDEEIEAVIALYEGDRYSVEYVEMNQMAINSKYMEQGYIWSRVIPEQEVRRGKIDLHLKVVENNPAHIHEIKISGNTKTFENIIRRELGVYPGDRFILSDVQRSLRDIFALGYFNGPPQVGTEPVNEEGDINLLISVEEKQTGYFRMGAGFSQLNSITGFFGVTENNFLGRGKRVSIDWEFGKYRQNLNLSYSEPYFLGTNNSMTVSIFNWIQNRVQQQFYTDRRKGFSVQLGRPFPLLDYTRIFTSYRLENVNLYDFSPLYPLSGSLRHTDWPLNKSSLLVSIARNSTDNPFHPTRGSITNLSAEFTGGPLGGNVDFMRYSASFSWFRSILWRFTYHMAVKGAVIDRFAGGAPVEEFEKYRLGGNRRYALRGYDFYEVVPEGNDIYVGGRFFSIFTQEVLFPFTPAIYGLVFYDVGNTWNSFSGAQLSNMRRGLGFGIRLEMPGIGNLGFDYGYGFDKRGGGAWEPHFAFGTFF